MPPLIAHIIFRLDVGGLENGLVNLINHMPVDRYRHVIICLTESTDFQQRIQRSDVEVYALHKRPGKDLKTYGRMFKLLRQLQPAIVHTRNTGTLDYQALAVLLRVTGRVHGEHGFDANDIGGSHPKYHRLRQLMSTVVHRYITVSQDLQSYLLEGVKVSSRRVDQIYNGVALARFSPAESALAAEFQQRFGQRVVFGTVGRQAEVKDPLTLARAFVRLLQQRPELRTQIALVMVGDGHLHQALQEVLADYKDCVWLPGGQSDVPEWLRLMQVFVLPSLSEGISNTILEAGATALPVIATKVGGNPELITPEVNGRLVPVQDPDAMAKVMANYFDDPEQREKQGATALAQVQSQFSMKSMVDRYLSVYDATLAS